MSLFPKKQYCHNCAGWHPKYLKGCPYSKYIKPNERSMKTTELLTEIDDLLSRLEDYTHGKDGDDITKMRGKIIEAQKQPAISKEGVPTDAEIGKAAREFEQQDIYLNTEIGRTLVVVSFEAGAKWLHSRISSPSHSSIVIVLRETEPHKIIDAGPWKVRVEDYEAQAAAIHKLYTSTPAYKEAEERPDRGKTLKEHLGGESSCCCDTILVCPIHCPKD